MERPGVKSAGRSLDVFELLALEPNGLTVAEIAGRLSVARSSTHAIVHTLFSRGYLAIEPGGRFTLGVRLIQLGLNVSDRLELRSVARLCLERLVEKTQETALLVVPDRGELLYVDKVISDARDIRTDPRMSMGRPLHCSSLGKALLATLDDEDVIEICSDGPLPVVTEFSIAEVEDLLADLTTTRKRGYSIDRQEAVPGVWCVGAPVRDHTNRAIAAISLSTISDFFDPATTGPLVLGSAVEISRAMGWDGDESGLYAAEPGSKLLLMADIGHSAEGVEAR